MVYPEWARGDPSGEECAGARSSVVVREAGDLLVAQPVPTSTGRTSAAAGDARPALLLGIALLAATFLVWRGLVSR